MVCTSGIHSTGGLRQHNVADMQSLSSLLGLNFISFLVPKCDFLSFVPISQWGLLCMNYDIGIEKEKEKEKEKPTVYLHPTRYALTLA